MHRLLDGTPLLTWRGKPYRVGKRDEDDQVVWENEDTGRPEMVHADFPMVIRQFCNNIPLSVLTVQDSIHATRLWTQIEESKAEHEKELGKASAAEKRNGTAPVLTFKIEDGEWDWFHKKMEDEKIGPKIFGVNSHALQASIKGMEKAFKEQAAVSRKPGGKGPEDPESPEDPEGEGGGAAAS